VRLVVRYESVLRDVVAFATFRFSARHSAIAAVRQCFPRCHITRVATYPVEPVGSVDVGRRDGCAVSDGSVW